MNDLRFKVLDGLNPNIANTTYRYPGVGRWTRHLDPDQLEPCVYGYHYATGPQVLDWLGADLYEAEPCPDHDPVHDHGKSVTCRLRLVRRFDQWDETNARLFAVDCAEHVLSVFETACPGDDRPRQAILAARAYARGEISRTALDAANAAAWVAARNAANAARDAARATAWVAWDTWAAARDVAREAAWAAAWAAAGTAARDAAREAAGEAARAAARVAARHARDTAREAERDWQYQRLLHYLGVSDAE